MKLGYYICLATTDPSRAPRPVLGSGQGFSQTPPAKRMPSQEYEQKDVLQVFAQC